MEDKELFDLLAVNDNIEPFTQEEILEPFHVQTPLVDETEKLPNPKG